MNRLRIFNSATQRNEAFEPDSGTVGVYVCGITPYDVTHLGHAFTYTFFDVVIRYLEHRGHVVRYVQNLTDIDDDILRKAREQGRAWEKLVEENTAAFLKDMRWLNNRSPDVFPRATEHIPEIIQMVKGLEERRYAYARNGNVYFDIDSFRDYGKLSKLPRTEMLPVANRRGNNPDDPNKDDPLDFVLWQAGAPGEPSWPSPWGEGRPGWHIECSVMSTKYLGKTIDIHGGGRDLVYPHHENSIAQSEGFYARPFVRYWMHTAMVRYQGEKMSKSLGNLVLVRDLRESYHPNIIRLCLLSHHYRTAWEFDSEMLAAARATNDLFRRAWPSSRSEEKSSAAAVDADTYESRFFAALDEDFDIPAAIQCLGELADRLESGTERPSRRTARLWRQAFHILGLEKFSA
jgi:cysteinyl-tRNA synthetase